MKCKCGCGQEVEKGRQWMKGHCNWKGGISSVRNRNGSRYKTICVPGHARADKGGYVLEHIILAENALGRSLPSKAQVHHVNQIESDNGPGNLVLCEDQKYHRLLHKRTAAFYATGNASAVKCCICKGYGGEDMSTISLRCNGYDMSYHRSCNLKKLNSRRKLQEGR